MANILSQQSAREKIGDDTKGSLRFPIKNIIKSAQFYNCWKTKSLLSLTLVCCRRHEKLNSKSEGVEKITFLAFHKSADNMFLSPSTPRKYHIVGVQFKLFLFALLFRHCMEFFCGVAAHFAEISSFFISSTHVSSRVRRVWSSGGKNSRELFPFSMNVRRSSAMIVNQFSFCFAQLNCIQLNLVELELLVRSSGPSHRRWWKIVIFPAD